MPLRLWLLMPALWAVCVACGAYAACDVAGDPPPPGLKVAVVTMHLPSPLQYRSQVAQAHTNMKHVAGYATAHGYQFHNLTDQCVAVKREWDSGTAEVLPVFWDTRWMAPTVVSRWAATHTDVDVVAVVSASASRLTDASPPLDDLLRGWSDDGDGAAPLRVATQPVGTSGWQSLLMHQLFLVRLSPTGRQLLSQWADATDAVFAAAGTYVASGMALPRPHSRTGARPAAGVPPYKTQGVMSTVVNQLATASGVAPARRAYVFDPTTTPVVHALPTCAVGAVLGRLQRSRTPGQASPAPGSDRSVAPALPARKPGVPPGGTPTDAQSSPDMRWLLSLPAVKTPLQLSLAGDGVSRTNTQRDACRPRGERPSGRLRIGVATFFLRGVGRPGGDRVGDAHARNMQRTQQYCLKHGYEFLDVTAVAAALLKQWADDPQQRILPVFHDARWVKPFVIHHVLTTAAAPLDALVFMDADVVLTNLGMPMEELLRGWDEPGDADRPLRVSMDRPIRPGADCYGINSGMFVLRASPAGIRLAAEWRDAATDVFSRAAEAAAAKPQAAKARPGRDFAIPALGVPPYHDQGTLIRVLNRHVPGNTLSPFLQDRGVPPLNLTLAQAFPMCTFAANGGSTARCRLTTHNVFCPGDFAFHPFGGRWKTKRMMEAMRDPRSVACACGLSLPVRSGVAPPLDAEDSV